MAVEQAAVWRTESIERGVVEQTGQALIDVNRLVTLAQRRVAERLARAAGLDFALLSFLAGTLLSTKIGAALTAMQEEGQAADLDRMLFDSEQAWTGPEYWRHSYNGFDELYNVISQHGGRPEDLGRAARIVEMLFEEMKAARREEPQAPAK